MPELDSILQVDVQNEEPIKNITQIYCAIKLSHALYLKTKNTIWISIKKTINA